MFLDEEQPHIMALNETKLDDTTQSAELSISNYPEIIRKDRTRYGGGVQPYRFTIQFLINIEMILLFEKSRHFQLI